MSRQQKPIYVSLISTTILSLIVSIFLFARKRRAKLDHSEKVVSHSVETSPEDTLAYWTADKKRDAKPAPMPVINEQHQEKRPPHTSRSDQD